MTETPPDDETREFAKQLFASDDDRPFAGLPRVGVKPKAGEE